MKQVKTNNKQRKRQRHESNMPRLNLLRKSKKYRAQTNNKFKRSNKWAKFYGSKMWRDLRAQKLQEQPLCERCLMHDIVRPATEVHHVCVYGSCPTEEEQWEWFLDYDNLMSVCHNCHNEIHSKYLRGYIYYWPFPYEHHRNKEVTF